MKSKAVGVGLGSAIFIFLMVAVLALVRPVYLRLDAALREFEEGAAQKLEEETGLALAYDSLSPSILIGLNFKNIAVKELASQKVLLSIKRASLRYDLRELFSEKPVLALKTLTVNGVNIEYDAVKDTEFIEKIKKLVEKNKAKKENLQVRDSEVKNADSDGEKTEKDEKKTLKKEIFDLPMDIIVKNLNLHYGDKNNDVTASFKYLKIDDFDSNSGLEIESSGRIFYKSALIKNGSRWTSAACNFLLSGTFFPNLEGSSALLSLSGAGGADYSISHLDMLVNYASDRLEVRTMRTVLPFSLFALYDFNKEKAELSADFDHFNPLKLVSIRKKSPAIKKIDGTNISGFLNASFGKKSLNYKTDLTFDLSGKVLGEELSLALKCQGDKNRVNISRLAANASFVDAYFNGSFDIKKIQPSGVFSLNYLTLKNGGVISTELYIDPYRNGFTCVAPQVFMNEKSFTGIQFTLLPGKNSLDFQFELLDFAHADYEEVGRLQIDGSFLTGREKSLLASLSLSNVFADSLVDTAAFFMPAEKNELMQSISQSMKPYIFTTELYFSSDFKDFSVNAPYCLFANTQRDKQLVSFAFDGSKETLQLSAFDLLFGNQTAHAEASIEFADSMKEFSFTSDLTFNSVPYHFFGNFSPEWISISGDYNFDAIVSIDEDIGATVQFTQLPLNFGKFVFGLSLNSIMHWDLHEGFSADIVSFELEEPSGNLTFNPHLALSGRFNNYGLEMGNISYTDNVSSLDGQGTFVWNINGEIFDSLHASLEAQSPLSAEKFTLSMDLTNPGQLPFSAQALKNDFYMSMEASVNSFPSARLLPLQNPENNISADFTASGTISNPFVSVTLHKSSLLLYGYPAVAWGGFVIDDTGAHLNDLNFNWSLLKLSDFEASFNPRDFNGKASMVVDLDLMGKSIHAPFNLLLEGSPPEKSFSLPEFFSLTLTSPEISGDFIKSDFPLKVVAMKSPERLDIVTDIKDGFRASYVDGGYISAEFGKGSPVQLKVDGSIIQNNLNLNISGIRADMNFICSEVEIPFVTFNSGILTGALKITGPTTDPEFSGVFSVFNPNFLIPFISENYLNAEKVIMLVNQGEAIVAPTPVKLGKGLASVEYRMEFNRWIPNFLELKINIDEDKKVPLDLSFPFIHAKGLASGNLNLSFTLPKDVTISGFVEADNTDVEIVATSLQNQFSIDDILLALPKENVADINVTVDFDILVGQKVQLLFNPFLRGVVAPGTPLSIYFDSYSGDLEFKSDIVLRGGELSWLSRNFYMKEGRIVFNETQDSIDPKITVRAETRERDENGNMVTITLAAYNQPVSTFNPVFTATPAKSEKEIMQLLGQVVSGDSEKISDVLVAGGDYFLHSTVIRRVENTLREMLNFDIFSIRTNVLQNSLKLSMDDKTNNKQITVGNFIDNSTVYMGKYFGSSIYVDSMLHWTYDETKRNDETTVNGLVFQPEIGFEMASPFVNIRLGVAPDIKSLREGLLNTLVPSTSMTLSWKFAF